MLKLSRDPKESFPYDKYVIISKSELTEIAKEYAFHWAKQEENPDRAARIFKEKFEKMLDKLISKIPTVKKN